MFEVLDYVKKWTGVVNTSGAVRGSICYKSGISSDGYVTLDLAKSSVQASISMYPVDKVIMRDDLGDTADANNKFAKSERCIWYEGGTFRTDLTVYSGIVNDYSTPGPYPTDTALYTRIGSGVAAPIYVSIASGQYGKLKDTSNAVYTATATARKNRNFDLLAIHNATPTAHFVYRVRQGRIGADYML